MNPTKTVLITGGNKGIGYETAKILTGSLVRNIGWWRGKISSIDGHSIGVLKHNE